MLSPDQAATVFGPWYTDDAITGPVLIRYVDEEGNPVDLTGAVPTGARLVDPSGVTIPATAVVAGTAPDTYLEVTLPGDPFTGPGVWAVDAALTSQVGTFRPAPLQFVVEDEFTGWHTVRGIRPLWRDAPRSDVVLYRLLQVARDQVVTYWTDKTVTPLSTVPARLADAQAAQARELWNASKFDPTQQGFGDEGFIIRPAKMSSVIKGIIWPPTRKPVVA